MDPRNTHSFKQGCAQGEAGIGLGGQGRKDMKVGLLKGRMMKYRVIESWTATYADPIRIEAGQQLSLSGETYDWDGNLWLWAKSAADGKEGWIPDDLPEERDGKVVSRETFSAIELTCVAGETVEGDVARHGWVWCKAEDGRLGWVPAKHLEAVCSDAS